MMYEDGQWIRGIFFRDKDRDKLPMAMFGKIIGNDRKTQEVVVYSSFGQPFVAPIHEIIIEGVFITNEENKRVAEKLIQAQITNYKLQQKLDTPLEVVKVMRNGPATIVFFSDGDKSVVKPTKETIQKKKFDYSAAVAYAIAKKVLKNSKRNFFEVVERQ
jgi:hypothetical protein